MQILNVLPAGDCWAVDYANTSEAQRILELFGTTLIPTAFTRLADPQAVATEIARRNPQYTFEKVGGPFEYMQPSRVLKEMDPTAYRCGVNDYEDGEGWVEISGDYYEHGDAEKAKQEFVEGLESEISDLESEIEELEASETTHHVSELAELNRKLAELQADLKTVETHSF